MAPAFAQQFSDVLRYSYLQPSGTARSLGAGNAFGSLGADFSTLSQNPAGLAQFRSNELMLTPSLKFSKSEAIIPGTSNSALKDDKSAFGFDNFGIVFNTTPASKKWKTFNVGIGVNRQNNYSQSIYYEGLAEGTIMNGFFKDAQRIYDKTGSAEGFDGFREGLAWSTFGIDTIDGQLFYDFLGNESAVVNRAHKVTTYGKMDEMTLSFAGNYDERLMVGATIGIPFVNYRLEGEYKESDPSGLVNTFDELTYTDYLKTSGVGVNLKIGVNYKVNQMLRIGAAFHTPTRLNLTESYSNTFTYIYTVGNKTYGGEPAVSPDGNFDYRLRTPWRAMLSGALVLKKRGFLSADVEWVDYGANAFNLTANVASTDNEIFERELNRSVQNAYQQVMNIRAGGEFVMGKFRLRAGVNLLGKPQKGEDGYNVAYTAGAGVREESFFLDLGWRRYTGKGSVSPYSDAPVATTSNVSSNLLLTLGFKF